MSPRDPSFPPGAAEIHRRLAPVLRDLVFPAQRWQVVTAADLYGCDGVTRTLVARLPEHRYQSFPELVGILASAIAPRTDGPRAPVRLPHQAPAPHPPVTPHPPAAPRTRPVA